MSSGQIRLNTATGEWVIYAPSRRKRPQDFCKPPQTYTNTIKSNHSCPFCPGNEENLEPTIIEFPKPDNSGWQTRVVANKFPALIPCGDTTRVPKGIYLTMAGYGKHEVIIESPEHDQSLAKMTLPEIKILIETYHQRYRKLMEDQENMMIIIFRNHGQEAGASLSHPHSQIIATSIVPQNRRWQEEEAQRYYDHWHRCVYCDMLTFEMEEKVRVIQENDSFVAFVPFAAEVPCEVWIMPKQHHADFTSMNKLQRSEFASILHIILKRLDNKLRDPDYNYVINSASRYKGEEPQLHWYCQIKPRLTTSAGFEMGAGISINPSIPEVDAAFLRDNIIFKLGL
jgi:UDPglucose--hexose-1-phosphate uridylyltransferase